MSADNYYTVKYNEDDGKWYLLHGFMSSLEDDVPALWNGHPGFSTWEEALASYDAQKNWSEYGLIQEQAPLDVAVGHAQLVQPAGECFGRLRHKEVPQAIARCWSGLLAGTDARCGRGRLRRCAFAPVASHQHRRHQVLAEGAIVGGGAIAPPTPVVAIALQLERIDVAALRLGEQARVVATGQAYLPSAVVAHTTLDGAGTGGSQQPVVVGGRFHPDRQIIGSFRSCSLAQAIASS